MRAAPGLTTTLVGDELLIYQPHGRAVFCLSADAREAFEAVQAGRPARLDQTRLDTCLQGLVEQGLVVAADRPRRKFLQTVAGIGLAVIACPRPAAAASCVACTNAVTCGMACSDNGSCPTNVCALSGIKDGLAPDCSLDSLSTEQFCSFGEPFAADCGDARDLVADGESYACCSCVPT
ncbi:MAG: hypothetical protein KC910_02370 [Candidatus Eremiobacteraeota bacterium]|nr:hypothetical protein [Candidatus Eremiobacteraeota bacterium]